jgi:hypothetical protein
MANSIGAYQAHRILEGEVDALEMGTELGTRPGVSGYDVTKVGFRSEPFDLVTFCDYDSESDMTTAQAVAKGQSGRIVTVVDAMNRSWGLVLVRKVMPVRRQRYLAAAGGATAGLYGLTLRWRCQAV